MGKSKNLRYLLFATFWLLQEMAFNLMHHEEK